MRWSGWTGLLAGPVGGIIIYNRMMRRQDVPLSERPFYFMMAMGIGVTASILLVAWDWHKKRCLEEDERRFDLNQPRKVIPAIPSRDKSEQGTGLVKQCDVCGCRVFMLKADRTCPSCQAKAA